MKTTRLAKAAIAAGVACLFLAGCTSVQEGPASGPPPGDAAPVVRGTEPVPAPIPQKSVPEGQSSLRKTAPDQPLVPPTKS